MQPTPEEVRAIIQAYVQTTGSKGGYERVKRIMAKLGPEKGAKRLQAISRKGGKARAAKMTKAERRESALKAINARWDRWRKEHPEGSKRKKKK